MISRGIRLLLGTPLLTARDEGFDLVTRHRDAIAKWFDDHCGWPLHVEREYVRLVKAGQRTSRGSFDRRRYTLLCLVCAELLAAPVTTAELLRERITRPVDGIPPFDPARNDERAAFEDVLEFLEQRGVLAGTGKYRVDRTLVRRLIEPSTTETKHEVMRRLVDEPVVYKEDLTPEQRSYLKQPAVRRGVEQAGFVLEEREEGFLLVDPDGLATDAKFPHDDTIVALALLDRLVQGPATHEELDATTQDLRAKYKVLRSEPGELTQDGLDVLVAFGLAEQDDTRARALPAAARYRR
ncbi:DUF2398 family protein [Lentzea tibetensis]|uniref:DUF2398 family protein n=1 Tax=Lentzea tibetensis TaxID=2591470 RepID=A0A563EY07_9PSEU|nr:DUF2398 family protein [Lentzea tibetensis]TWP52549.1 DUF2398 family protein [Lentzea tibetensis]